MLFKQSNGAIQFRHTADIRAELGARGEWQQWPTTWRPEYLGKVWFLGRAAVQVTTPPVAQGAEIGRHLPLQSGVATPPAAVLVCYRDAAILLAEKNDQDALIQLSPDLINLRRHGDFTFAVVGAFAGDELFDQPLQGVGAQLSVGNQHLITRYDAGSFRNTVSRAGKFVNRRDDFCVLTAMANALGWAIRTTNFLPRVTPV